jgi:hypothetical protein
MKPPVMIERGMNEPKEPTDRAAKFLDILDEWFNSPGADKNKWKPRCSECCKPVIEGERCYCDGTE